MIREKTASDDEDESDDDKGEDDDGDGELLATNAPPPLRVLGTRLVFTVDGHPEFVPVLATYASSSSRPANIPHPELTFSEDVVKAFAGLELDISSSATKFTATCPESSAPEVTVKPRTAPETVDWISAAHATMTRPVSAAPGVIAAPFNRAVIAVLGTRLVFAADGQPCFVPVLATRGPLPEMRSVLVIRKFGLFSSTEGMLRSLFSSEEDESDDDKGEDDDGDGELLATMAPPPLRVLGTRLIFTVDGYPAFKPVLATYASSLSRPADFSSPDIPHPELTFSEDIVRAFAGLELDISSSATSFTATCPESSAPEVTVKPHTAPKTVDWISTAHANMARPVSAAPGVIAAPLNRSHPGAPRRPTETWPVSTAPGVSVAPWSPVEQSSRLIGLDGSSAPCISPAVVHLISPVLETEGVGITRAVVVRNSHSAGNLATLSRLAETGKLSGPPSARSPSEKQPRVSAVVVNPYDAVAVNPYEGAPSFHYMAQASRPVYRAFNSPAFSGINSIVEISNWNSNPKVSSGNSNPKAILASMSQASMDATCGEGNSNLKALQAISLQTRPDRAITRPQEEGQGQREE